MLLSELSENKMNSQNRPDSRPLSPLGEKKTNVDLSCHVSNILLEVNAKGSVILSIMNQFFSVDFSNNPLYSAVLPVLFADV